MGTHNIPLENPLVIEGFAARFVYRMHNLFPAHAAENRQIAPPIPVTGTTTIRSRRNFRATVLAIPAGIVILAANEAPASPDLDERFPRKGAAVVRLTALYDHVQQLKDRPFEAPPDVVATVSRLWRREHGREITSAELQTLLDGLSWTARMADEHNLDYGELLTICEDLDRTTRKRIDGMDGDRLAVGVGAGFFTGLYVGMLVRDG